VHRKFHNPAAIQMCTLMNIKTGGCSEDCSYVSTICQYYVSALHPVLTEMDTN
jgi:biotin synthase